jgi:hypothetical protein
VERDRRGWRPIATVWVMTFRIAGAH